MLAPTLSLRYRRFIRRCHFISFLRSVWTLSIFSFWHVIFLHLWDLEMLTKTCLTIWLVPLVMLSWITKIKLEQMAYEAMLVYMPCAGLALDNSLTSPYPPPLHSTHDRLSMQPPPLTLLQWPWAPWCRDYLLATSEPHFRNNRALPQELNDIPHSFPCSRNGCPSLFVRFRGTMEDDIMVALFPHKDHYVPYCLWTKETLESCSSQPIPLVPTTRNMVTLCRVTSCWCSRSTKELVLWNFGKNGIGHHHEM
jgi:hypothetical protein